MNSKSRNKMLSGTAYLIFTVLALAVICLTLYAVAGFFSRRNNVKTPEDTAPLTQAYTTSPMVTEPPATEMPQTQPPAPVTTEPPAQEPADAEPMTFYMPSAGTISKAYSADMPVFSSTMNDYRVHDGIDLEGAVGDVVVCCANGTIADIYDDPFWGKCITVDHGDGLCSYYKGLSEEIPKGIAKGSAVSGGTVIGALGDTAIIEIAQEPHLHFAITVNGVSADPCTYLPAKEAMATPADASAQE